MSVKTERLTRAALLFALVIVVQNFRLMPLFSDANPASTFVIGSLVNATLLVACEMVGCYYAAAIGIIAPFVAMAQGHLSLFVMLPIVIVGNLIFLLCYNLFRGTAKRRLLGIIVGATFKWQFFVLAIPYAFQLFSLERGIPAMIVKNFLGTTQIVTAFVGGGLACIIIYSLGKMFGNFANFDNSSSASSKLAE